MNNYSEILVKKYRNHLFSKELPFLKTNKVMPLSEIDDTDTIEMFNSFLNHLAILGKPIYQSRQEFLRYLFVDANGEFIFHYPNSGESSTLMGGLKIEDPFYDPNNKELKYHNEQNISRIRKNLTSRFFYGDYKRNEKDKLFKTISLENVSIEDFNEIFTPPADSFKDKHQSFIENSKIKIEELLSKIVIMENFDNKIKNQHKTNSLIESDKSYNENVLRGIEHSFFKMFFHENGRKLNSRPLNNEFNSVIEVRDVLIFNHGSYYVTKIEVIVLNGIHYLKFTVQDFKC